MNPAASTHITAPLYPAIEDVSAPSALTVQQPAIQPSVAIALIEARIGAGVRFGFWGVNISGTQVFATWTDMRAAFDQAINHGNSADLTAGSVLTLNFVLYF